MFDNLTWNIPEFSLCDLTYTEHREFLDFNRGLVQAQADKLAKVCTDLLLPTQAKWGPLILRSVYRCPQLNTHIGGSSTSQHMRCEAADFVVVGRTSGELLYEVFEWIYKESKIPFGQLIYELGSWIHLSLGEPFREKERCREVFTYREDAFGKRLYRRLFDVAP